MPVDLDDESYLMVTQVHWEDDIIWDGEEAKQRVMQVHRTRAEYAGWVPSTNSRTATQFLQQSSQTCECSFMLVCILGVLECIWVLLDSSRTYHEEEESLILNFLKKISVK